jgi:hypothetical protein
VLGDSVPEAGPDIDNAQMPGGHLNFARLDIRSDRRGGGAHSSTEVAQPVPGQLRRSSRRTGPAWNCVKASCLPRGPCGAWDGLRLNDVLTCVRGAREYRGLPSTGGGLGGPRPKAGTLLEHRSKLPGVGDDHQRRVATLGLSSAGGRRSLWPGWGLCHG